MSVALADMRDQDWEPFIGCTGKLLCLLPKISYV